MKRDKKKEAEYKETLMAEILMEFPFVNKKKLSSLHIQSVERIYDCMYNSNIKEILEELR